MKQVTAQKRAKQFGS